MKNIIKKGELHPNNPHKGKYDFEVLVENLPELKQFVKKNPRGEDTIDFSNNEAVILLNKALLKTFYINFSFSFRMAALYAPRSASRSL